MRTNYFLNFLTIRVVKNVLPLLFFFSYPSISAQDVDTDLDGIFNLIDLDDDNDGILDLVEGTTDRSPNFSMLSTATTVGEFTNNQQFLSNSSCVSGYNSTMNGLYNTTVLPTTRPALSPRGDNEGNFVLGITGDQTSAYEEINLNFTKPVYLKIYNSNKAGGAVANGSYGMFDDNDEWTLTTDVGTFNIVDSAAFQSSLTVNNGNTIKFQNGTANNSTAFDVRTNTLVQKLVLRFRSTNVNTSANYSPIRVAILMPNDTDCDASPNYLDLDSDNDGCFDAVEGDENVTKLQLNPNGTISGGINASGVPNLVNTSGVADIGSDVGQGIGASQNALVKDTQCDVCYKPVITTGTILDTLHGITSLGRAGADNDNWPMVRKGAWTALESRTKGFVPNRLTTTQISQIPDANLVEGMMVYNINLGCLQVNTNGLPTGWTCFDTQTCPTN